MWNYIHIHGLLQVLHNLGKADRTTDTTFEQHVVNFTDNQVFFLLVTLLLLLFFIVLCVSAVLWAHA